MLASDVLYVFVCVHRAGNTKRKRVSRAGIKLDHLSNIKLVPRRQVIRMIYRNDERIQKVEC